MRSIGQMTYSAELRAPAGYGRAPWQCHSCSGCYS